MSVVQSVQCSPLVQLFCQFLYCYHNNRSWFSELLLWATTRYHSGMHTVPESISEDNALAKEKVRTEELTAKLQHLSVRNVNKQIKRRDQLLNHRSKSKKWTEKDNLRIRPSANLKLNCTLLIALFTVFDKGSIDLKIRLKLHLMKGLIFKPS